MKAVIIISNWLKNQLLFPNPGLGPSKGLSLVVSFHTDLPHRVYLVKHIFLARNYSIPADFLLHTLKNITDNFKPQVHCFGHCWKVPLCCAPSMLVSNISSIFIMSFIWIILTHPQYWSANQYQHHHKKDYCASFFPMICTQKLKANFPLQSESTSLF